MLVITYPLDRIDFRPWARSTLAVDSLEDLHLRPDPVPFENYVVRLNYYKQLLIDNFDVVLDQYLELARLVAPLFDGIVLRQLPPSFRCHLAGAGTTSDFHRDGDPDYGITPGVINGWVPLTTVGGTNSVFIERQWESEDYHPVTLHPGQMLLFDAYHLKHGSRANHTPTTRVSFDFRFLPNNRQRAHDLGISVAHGRHEPEGTRA